VTNEAGEPQRAAGQPFWRDHFVCPGQAELKLAPGRFQYVIERGPEYRRESGEFTLGEEPQTRTIEVRLERLADLAARGWWSGDLHVHRDLKEIPLHLRAEDLHVAPVITWWNGRNQWEQRPLPDETLVRVDADRYFDVMAGEDEREGGALLFFGLKRPLALPGDRRKAPEYPSPMKFVLEARQLDAWIDVEKPFWWDTPVWLASGKVDTIGIANNHMCRSTMYETEAWGRPRDTERLPAPRGNGRWSQEIYYHVLNSGLRMPPSAGSASGVLPNPVGYNRVYACVPEDFTYEKWWDAVESGRTFVTNGPLLICRANEQLPGSTHTSRNGEPVRLRLDIELISNDPVPAIEIIQNGEVAQRLPVDAAPAKMQVPVAFRESGWILVRAVTDNPRTFRFASTAPFYVEIGEPRISRRSARFFVDWCKERAEQIRRRLSDDSEKQREVLEHHLAAERFWKDRLDRANAE
jgi:hypothetical protein